MEYYYDRRQKRWIKSSDRSCPISEEKLKLLRDKKENKKHFLIVKTGDLYPGLHTDLVYFDISDVKLLLDGGNRVFLKYNDVFVKSKTQIRRRWIKNPEILKTVVEDPKSAIDFVEDTSYLGYVGITIREKTMHNAYWSLSPEMQLYYQMEGNRLDII